MEPIYFKESFKTPKIVMDKEKGEFLISGRSLPENPKEFYAPVKDWLVEYFKSPNEKTKFVFEIAYFNTASSKMVLDILFILTKAHGAGNSIDIIWRHEKEDEDMEEAGNDYSTIIKMPILLETVDGQIGE